MRPAETSRSSGIARENLREDAGGGRIDPQSLGGRVDLTEDFAGCFLSIHGDRPDQRAQLPHEGGGLGVVAHDVADHQGGGAVGGSERVIPIAAHQGILDGGPVTDLDLQVRRLNGGVSKLFCSATAID